MTNHSLDLPEHVMMIYDVYMKDQKESKNH